jgi:hypothetical protein
MTTVSTDAGARRLRLAAMGGLAFVVLYVVHRILQGGGPDGADPATVAAYNVTHRGALLASEVAVGLALLAFLAFLAPLVPQLRQAGHETIAVALLAVGVLFVAMGFVSMTAETALVAVAETNELAAVSALNQFQGRVPNVLATAALAAVIGLAALRANLAWRWLGYLSVVAAVVFLLGFIFSIVGSTPEGGSSIFGIAAFVVWMILVTVALARVTTETKAAA